MHIGVLPTYIPVYHMCALCLGRLEGFGSQGTKVSATMGADNQIPVLRRAASAPNYSTISPAPNFSSVLLLFLKF